MQANPPVPSLGASPAAAMLPGGVLVARFRWSVLGALEECY
jgi:hypothetical protein